MTNEFKLPKHISGCGEYGKGFLAGMKHQRDSQWISVDDRLPENEDVVYCYGIEMEYGWDIDNPKMIFGDGQKYGDRIDFYGPRGCVTHWMQPTPPNETVQSKAKG